MGGGLSFWRGLYFRVVLPTTPTSSAESIPSAVTCKVDPSLISHCSCKIYVMPTSPENGPSSEAFPCHFAASPCDIGYYMKTNKARKSDMETTGNKICIFYFKGKVFMNVSPWLFDTTNVSVLLIE